MQPLYVNKVFSVIEMTMVDKMTDSFVLMMNAFTFCHNWTKLQRLEIIHNNSVRKRYLP